MQPYREKMVLLVARDDTLNNEMTRVNIQISSNDTYNALIHKISGVKNSIIETDFTSKDTALEISYSEENTEFIKDCSDSLFFKRYAEKIEETDKFNYCNKKCVPLIFDSLMEVIDHNTPKCADPIEKDEYCINGLKGMGITSELKSTCMKQCKNKGSTLETTEKKLRPYFPIGKDMNTFK